jgi:hypothetical protein
METGAEPGFRHRGRGAGEVKKLFGVRASDWWFFFSYNPLVIVEFSLVNKSPI